MVENMQKDFSLNFTLLILLEIIHWHLVFLYKIWVYRFKKILSINSWKYKYSLLKVFFHHI
jgi:hypothetical protein